MSAIDRVPEVASEELVERLLHLDRTRVRSAHTPDSPRAPDRDTRRLGVCVTAPSVVEAPRAPMRPPISCARRSAE